ncbi:MAG: GNAT family N-acetyltransferase [Henriciella sp.]|jgi:putative acetyltransferase|nr:GNAT family N-acetyltransferase [Henriciella sp.]MBO6695894.1 GNAT family N-acetyltransferase [Henriciella sp.]
MPTNYLLRTAGPEDYDALGELIFDAIHNGPTQYTPAQSKAWAPAPRSGPDWAERLASQHIIAAEQGGEIQGFMSIEPGGYVDFAYIRPGAQGSGLFRQLFEAVLDRAKAQGDTELSTHASLMAQPAFAAMGFEIDYHETVEVDGQSLPRARMTKRL